MQQQSPEPIWQALTHDPVAFATVLLVVVTSGLWLATFLLWRATVHMAKEAKESADAQGERMERSIAESARVVEAMQKANQLAKDAQRPWIVVEAIVDSYKYSGSLIQLMVRVRYKNIGKSVATGLYPMHWVGFAGEDLAEVREQQNRFSAPESGGMVLMPGAEFEGHTQNGYVIDTARWFLDPPRIYFGIVVSARYYGGEDEHESRRLLKATMRTYQLGSRHHDVGLRQWLFKEDLPNLTVDDLVLTQCDEDVR